MLSEPPQRCRGVTALLCLLGLSIAAEGCDAPSGGRIGAVERALGAVVRGEKAQAATLPTAQKPAPPPPADAGTTADARATTGESLAEVPAARPPAATDGPRVFAKTRNVWIRERPSWSSEWLGYLWPGESVKLANLRPFYARGCDRWYAVEPRGYVCVDGRRATLDQNDAELAEVLKVPGLASPSAHRYAESLGAERYYRLPSPAEQRAREPGLARHLALIDAARNGEPVDETLAGVDLTPAPRDAVDFARLPVDLQVPRLAFRRDSTIAYLDQYRHGDRSFLLTADLVWVPKDRVKPLDTVTFRGAHLDRGVRLPLAFFREHARPAFERAPDGHFSDSGRSFARLAWVELTGMTQIDEGQRYLQTREAGLWVLESDCVLPQPSELTPWGARVGGAPQDASEHHTWLEASVYGGWLIAYSDTLPVFVTLMAPGRGGGKPADAKNLVSTSSTPLGTFPITGKFVTATMDGPEDVVHSDVPWVQNFRSAHSIHTAYWHDAWGERVSGGCLNVSPADGRFLFGFTDPAVPEGWHGVRWNARFGPTTTVVVHR